MADPVTAAVSALSSVLGLWGQSQSNRTYLQGVKDTNAANLQIARETNQANMDKLLQEQKFSRESTAMANAYNDPAAQRARLIRAGINPAALSDSVASIAASSPISSPMIGAHMVAPDRLPHPFERIGGDVKDYINNQILSDDVKRSKMDLYQKNVDTQMYLQEKVARYKKEMVEIMNSKLDADEKRIRLNFLNDNLRMTNELLDKNNSLTQANYDNAIKTGQEIDARTGLIHAQKAEQLAATSRLDKESVQRIVNMRTEEMCNRVFAKVARDKADSDIVKNRNEIAKIVEECSSIRDQREFENLVRPIKFKIAQWDAQSKEALASLVAVQLRRETLMSESEVRSVINRVLGVDIQDALGSAAKFLGLHHEY